jgi:hypothetical protein
VLSPHEFYFLMASWASPKAIGDASFMVYDSGLDAHTLHNSGNVRHAMQERLNQIRPVEIVAVETSGRTSTASDARIVMWCRGRAA